ncbi:hypothetical protein A3L04_02515 [Thermococcus chitonophagus]|uniref:Uncharacterized protein n=1 Tax=Thermococcus chitonophagus TaxID=54262 RepID=A0A160VS86_9EURY|nr:hypothetical protein A3L04_02515 [Thermococcus chitonophagus]CUX77276.1 hypothetical protein CHITON_0497 [Thermococcus chitonophagus]
MGWREELRKEGFLDVGDFIIELIYVNCPCEPIPPALAIYDKKENEWYRVDEITEANNYTEACDWAIEVIERIRNGEEVKIVSLDGPAPPKVIAKLRKTLQKLLD